MNVYVFLGLLLLAYAFCALVLFVSGLIVKSRALKIVGGIALAPVVAAVLLLVIAVGMGERRSKDPAWVFEQEFLTPPPREVTGLRGHATEMNNGGFAYLSFSAPPEVIDSLISDWMVAASPSDLPRRDRPRSGGALRRFRQPSSTAQSISGRCATDAVAMKSSTMIPLPT